MGVKQDFHLNIFLTHRDISEAVSRALSKDLITFHKFIRDTFGYPERLFGTKVTLCINLRDISEAVSRALSKDLIAFHKFIRDAFGY